jgi:hypothetical protein
MRGRMGVMPRFALKDLLLSTTLIALGLACYVWVQRSQIPLLEHPIILLPLIGSGALVGAGILHPFRVAWMGALIGALAMLALVGCAVATAKI